MSAGVPGLPRCRARPGHKRPTQDRKAPDSQPGPGPHEGRSGRSVRCHLSPGARQTAQVSLRGCVSPREAASRALGAHQACRCPGAWLRPAAESLERPRREGCPQRPGSSPPLARCSSPALTDMPRDACPANTKQWHQEGTASAICPTRSALRRVSSLWHYRPRPLRPGRRPGCEAPGAPASHPKAPKAPCWAPRAPAPLQREGPPAVHSPQVPPPPCLCPARHLGLNGPTLVPGSLLGPRDPCSLMTQA